MIPSGRARALALAGLALALLPGLGAPGAWTAWAWFWAVLLGLGALDAAFAVRPGDWRLELESPEILAVGRPSGVTLRVAAGSRSAFRVRVRLEIPDVLSPVPAADVLGENGAGETEIVLLARRRGAVAIEEAWLRWEGPLGLIVHERRIPLAVETTAVPDLAPVREAALKFHLADSGRVGVRLERHAGEGSDFESLREFVPGHDPRAIDWKSSARHTRLLVRRYRAERDHQIVLAVDTGRLMAEPLDGVARLDHAIHAALTLAFVGLKSGDRVGLYGFDARPGPWLAPRAGTRSFPALLRASRDLAYGGEETNFTLGLTSLLTSLTRRSLVIVFTDFADSIGAELMAENLDRVARRHLTLLVSLSDPGLDRWMRAAPGSMEDVHRSVVARSLVREREIVLRRLRRTGIRHVDAPPHRIGTALVNRYLEIKRRERI